MGTVMEAKIKEAFEEWKKTDPPDAGHKQESNVSNTETPDTDKAPIPKGSLPQQILAYIQVHPGVTGKELRRLVQERSPDTPVSYVPAILKGLFDAHRVRREEVKNEAGVFGRNTFAYYLMTEQEYKAAKRKAEKRKAAKAAPPQKRAYNRRPREELRVDEGITSLVPITRPTHHAARALDVGPTTVSISISVASGESYALTLADAKFIYKQLNQIFGGGR